MRGGAKPPPNLCDVSPEADPRRGQELVVLVESDARRREAAGDLRWEPCALESAFRTRPRDPPSQPRYRLLVPPPKPRARLPGPAPSVEDAPRPLPHSPSALP